MESSVEVEKASFVVAERVPFVADEIAAYLRAEMVEIDIAGEAD